MLLFDEFTCYSFLIQGWDSSYDGEMADFAHAVLSGEALQASAVWALDDLKVLLALFESADKGSWVKVEDVGLLDSRKKPREL